MRHTLLTLPVLLLITLKATAQIAPRLLVAIQQNNLQAVQAALSAGDSPNTTDSLGATPLMWACYKADISVVKLLIQHGARTQCRGIIRVDNSTYYGNLTGLAVGLNKLPLLRYLIETLKLPINEPEYNYKTGKYDGWTPAEWATARGHLEVLRYLAKWGADLEVGKGNLVAIAISESHSAIVGWLLEQKIVLNKAHPRYNYLSYFYFHQLLPLVQAFEQQGRYETAALGIEQRRIIYGEKVSKTDNEYANILNSLGGLSHKMGHYEKAESLYKECLLIQINTLGKQHPSYATTLNNLAYLYGSMGQYKKAEPLFHESLIILEKAFKKQNSHYTTTLRNLADLYHWMGRYKKSDSLYQECLRIQQAYLNEQDPEYATTLNNLADLYRSIGQYKQAEPLYRKALSIRAATLGEQHPDYATTLNNLGLLYWEMDQYKQAEPLYRKALMITETILGRQHPDYAISQINLATLYKRMGQYEQAKTLYQENLAIIETNLGKWHPDYAVTLNSLAGLYRSIGQYKQAESLYKEALAITESANGRLHLSYATTLSNLASLYNFMGQYEKTELSYREALAIIRASVGKQHPSYASLLNDLGDFYKFLGQFEKATNLYVEGFSIIQASLGKQQLSYASALSKLADLYRSIGQYTKAEPLYNECLHIQRTALGNQHPSYGSTLNNLGELYRLMGQYKQAEPLYEESLIIIEASLGKQHLSYAITQNNLALLYMLTGQYKQAESLYKESLAIIETKLGNQHPDYAITLSNLAGLYESMGQYAKAELFFKQCLLINQHNLLQIFTFTSSIQQADYTQANRSLFTQSYSFAFRRHHDQPSSVGWAYDNALFHNGLLLNASQHLKRTLSNNTDPKIRQVFEQFQQARTALNAQRIPPADKLTSTTTLEARADSLEQVLIRQSQAFRDFRQNALIKWSQVQQKLRPNEAAIEFVAFQYQNGKKWTDSTLYAAFVLRPGYSQPKLVSLFDERQLAKLLDASTKKDIDQKVNEIYRANRSAKGPIGVSTHSGSTQLTNGQQLTQLIWQPLDSLLKGVDTVYFAPAGRLHEVAFAALPHLRASANLSDSLCLRQVLSTRLIAQVGNNYTPLPSQFSAHIFGDIDYGNNPDRLVTPTMLPIRPARKPTHRNPKMRSEEEEFSDLEYSTKELNQLQKQLAWPKVQLYRRQAASKDQFIALSGQNFGVLHVSSHAFFLADPQPQVLAQAGSLDENQRKDRPLLRSGLALACANYFTRSGQRLLGEHEGIVNGEEVADMDLSHTSLVCLAACKTGRGVIHDSEGVFGLQRSFKLAGARYLLMSLWDVADEATSEFMITFYEQLSKQKDVRKAFESTQATYRVKYRNEPFKWAAFVLVE
ncbi:hypothetical protein GCM10028805_37790 [Spirosoma harenae]